MKIIEKDILTVDSGVICHQVNCQSAMNSGLAKSIREKWPIVYTKFYNYSESFKDNRFLMLGNCLMVPVEPELTIANIFGQLNYGYDGQRYTDYGALKSAFLELKQGTFLKSKEQIYFPYNFGCDRGGADWNIVSAMINFYFPNSIICKI